MDNDGGWFWVVVIGLVIWGIFSGNSSSSSSSYNGYSRNYDGYEEEYEEPPITSDNWECTEDCSGHEAGYEWASEEGISDPGDCGGNSNSFIEGCEAYANELMMEEEESYEEEYEESYW